MKSATSLTPPSTGLSGIQFSTRKLFESLTPKVQKKYNNIEIKSGRLFTASKQHLKQQTNKQTHSIIYQG